ncbi:serine/threonine-protein kinase [Marinicella sp. S1101]|uniref:serine/threonine-protein kinase n=1 Tax=Marinicella marina TaxID=2996016 RepID=UPI002260CAC7|nr:serine/threonine-protein kinase [Marinicella marina]MCX7554247.1 serine/threonine-protein kinase [Marinicella marina]MDJ1138760.1 serine/threonine-protein kinase [Marinicella marina]
MSDKELDKVLRSLLENTPSDAPKDTDDMFDQGLNQALPETMQASFSGFKDIEIGSQFNAYRITKHIATGGMGKIFLAQRTDGQYQNQVALKILSTPFPDDKIKARFLRECQTLADLKHPYIISILDSGIDDYQRPWFAADYIDGLSITDYALQNKVSLDEKVKMIKDICQAVDFAHSQNIIHRDIKPANILVQKNHHRAIPQVLDFGIAYRKSDSQLTMDGLAVGTPGYMAPEQIKQGLVDERSDIFSLGVVIYELFSTLKPFKADSLIEIQNKTLNAYPPKLTKLINGFPKELQLITEACLNKDSKNRYQTIAQLLTDLTNWQKGYPISIKRISLYDSFKAAVKRNKLATGVLSLAVVAIFFSSFYYTYRIDQERQQAITAKNESDELLNYMLKDLYAQLQQVGRTDILKNLATKSLSQLSKYKFENNQQMQIQKAQGYLNIADVLENEKVLDEAEQAVKESIHITNQLLKVDDQATDALTIKIKATATLASIYHLQGELEKSELMLNEVESSMPVIESMSDELLFSYWELLHSFTWNQMEQSAYLNAQSHLDRMMQVINSGEKKSNLKNQWLIRKYRTFQTQGWNQLELKEYQQSIDDFDTAITLINKLLLDEPNHAQFKMHEQLILNQLAYVFLLDQQPAQAEQTSKNAIDLGVKLSNRLPENKRVSRELAYSWSTLGDLMLEQEQLSAATEAFKQSLQISINLAQIEPNNQSAQNDLAVDSLGVAKIWLKRGDEQQAESLFLQAEQAIASIAQKDNASLYYIHTYVWALMYLGKTQAALPYIQQLKNNQGWGSRMYQELIEAFPELTTYDKQ